MPKPEVQPSRRRRYTDVRGITEYLAISERHVRRLVLERRIWDAATFDSAER